MFLRFLRLSLPVLVATVASGWFAPPPAAAHPFGPPQTVEVAQHDGDVTVRWRFGATDDIAYLGLALGVLPADRATLDGAVFYEDGDAATLASAAPFHRYLLDHIHVTGSGPCAGTVVEPGPTGSLAEDGIVVAFSCPEDTGSEVTVAVDMLLDQHPAYRTMATGPGGQRTIYTGEDTAHTWTLSAPVGDPTGSPEGSRHASLGLSAALQLGGITAGVMVLALGIWWWRRRVPRT